jgi:tetratricopeptide (TPR) repeat protein
MGLCLIETGKDEEAMAELEEALKYSNNHPSPLAALGQLYGRLGWKDKQTIWQQLLERREKECVPAFSLALCQIDHSEKEPAFRWLERALEEHSSFLVFVKAWPAFDCLHSDPRFAALTRRIGLPP